MEFEDKTLEELLALRKAIIEDPANQTPPGACWPYTRDATAELSTIEWLIKRKQKESKQRETGRQDD